MKPGDKIVCVNARFPADVRGDQLLREGEVYTVRWVGTYTHFIDGTYRGVRLAEIHRGDDPAGYDPGDMPFRADRFKPVVSPKNEKRIAEVVE